MAAKSPTAKSLAHLRCSGYFATVVEQWVPGANIRRDAFGFADILAVRADRSGVLFVQTTSRSNMSARRKKILSIMEASACVFAGNQIEVHGWEKDVLTIWFITKEDFLLRGK